MNVVAWGVAAVVVLMVCLAVYDYFSPPWSLRAFLYWLELNINIPIGWLLVPLSAFAILLVLFWAVPHWLE